MFLLSIRLLVRTFHLLFVVFRMFGPQQKSEKLFAVVKALYVLLFATLPFSLAIDMGLHQVNLPSELIIVLLLPILGFYFFKTKVSFQEHLKNPIVISSLLYIAWMWITVAFSSNFLASAKYSLVNLAHYLVFFLGPIFLLKKDPRLFPQLILGYSVSFALIFFYIWYNHSGYEFSIPTSVLVGKPFYSDHALYGTCASLLLGIFFFDNFNEERKFYLSKNIKQISILLAILFAIGIFLSFSRAVWLSCSLSMVFILMTWWFKVRFRHWLMVLVLGIATVFLFQKSIFNSAAIDHSTTSKKTTGILEEFRSITDLKTNASNMERLNRYRCALRMFKDRPLLGFGPGTFQSAYLPYQIKEEMTYLSVTEDKRHLQGRGGSVHSEYLEALSEMGILGFIFFVVLMMSSLRVALQLLQDRSSTDYWLVLGILFGLFAYLIHGLFNNFLHQDKFSCLFWLLLAWLSFKRDG